jgi:hypothetical protein
VNLKRLATAALLCTGVFAQGTIEPVRNSGQGVTGAFEGWFANPDGSFSLLFGYYNRNASQQLDIPTGPDNKIEPGGPDQGQPTHFFPKRGWGIFTIKVPKDFGTKQLTWTLTANGKTAEVNGNLKMDWELAPFKDATNNTPPYVGFKAEGPFVNGPGGPPPVSVNVTLPAPLTLDVWVADDASLSPGATRPKTPPATVTWTKYRGPGSVTFSEAKPPIEPATFKAPASTTFSGKATTTVTFSEPGDYVLNVVANDWSGEGGRGFQCCWSNGKVNVTVKSAR